MARRSLWSISHAVLLRLSPSCRCSPTAEIPRVSVVIRYAAQNHWVSGSLALWRTVPEVSETCASFTSYLWRKHVAGEPS